MVQRPFRVIGELINHSFARARRAWDARDPAAYQVLARRQAELGADYLTVNLDGTQTVRIRKEDMFDFLPDVVPALQEETSLPLAFDNPGLEFHRRALAVYDRAKSGVPIVNSVAASRENLDEWLDLIVEYDTKVVVMASEKFVGADSAQCLCGEDVYRSAKHFVELLSTRAGRSNDQIIVDPGLAPVGADTYGLVNMGLDAMRRISQDPDLAGVHLSVGLTNFSFGVPQTLRTPLENAYLTLALEAGLDFALCNPEKALVPLSADDPVLLGVRAALEGGRPDENQTQEEAGFCQAEKIMELF
jgi:5-methyltetrahydrofolate corrinoid/iron sulfur protein methyltransferase